MKSIDISLRGCTQEVAPVPGSVVLPYSKKKAPEVARSTDSEPVIAVLFSTPLDMEALGKRLQIHHLYYNAFACSSIPLDAHIGSGDVYKATADEKLRLVGSQGKAGEELYKIYLPNSLKRIAKGAEVIYGLNVLEELEKVRSTGLCVVIGGANILGTGFLSNSLRVPVSVVGDTLVINGEDQGALYLRSPSGTWADVTLRTCGRSRPRDPRCSWPDADPAAGVARAALVVDLILSQSNSPARPSCRPRAGRSEHLRTAP
jgi:hypothetical protein